MSESFDETGGAGGIREVSWEEFWEERDGLQPGEHVSIVGPTGTGKTHGLVWFAEDFDGHAILVVTKGADKMIDRLVKERGWILTRDVGDIFTPDGRPGRLLRKNWSDRWEKRRERPPQRIVYWPQAPTESVRSRADHLQAALEALIDRAYEYCRREKRNRCFVGIDETMFAAMELDMNRPLTMLWNEGRSMGLSVGAAMQRTAWISKSARSAPRYVIVFDTTDPDDLGELAKMAGLYRRNGEFREILDGLGDHEHLLIVTRGRDRQVVRSRVVIRQRRVDADAKGAAPERSAAGKGSPTERRGDRRA